MENINVNGKEYVEPQADNQKVLSEMGIDLFEYYLQENILVASDSFVEKFGGPKIHEDAANSIAREIVHKDDWDVIYKLVDDLQRGEKMSSGIMKTKDLKHTSMVSLIVKEWDDAGKPLRALGVVCDYTVPIKRTQLIEALSKDYVCAFHVDFEGQSVEAIRLSNGIKEMFGDVLSKKPSYEQALKTLLDSDIVKSDKEEFYREASYDNVKKQLKSKDVFMYDFKCEYKERTLYYRIKIVSLDDSGDLKEAVVGFADVSKEKRKELEKYAYVDPVTGGDNYIRFKEKVRELDMPGYIVSMDIHSFKIINSVCGIQKGDETLKEIWKCIERCLRMSDKAGHINADHFVIYMSAQSRDEVRASLNHLTDNVEQLSKTMGIPEISPYFGVSVWNPDKRIEQTYSEANTAKHTVKDRKDVNIAFHSQKDTDRMLEERSMEEAFAPSISNRSFEVWYQPKYSPDVDKPVGAEALIRWRKPNGTLLTPGAFIPLFERNGMIRILDEYVFRTVCEQQKAWLDKGIDIIPVSINLSRASLYFSQVVEEYKIICDEIGIDPKYVPIEITESATIDNSDVRELAYRFYDAGFPLHMDDFGSGYSSLATLNILHFDTLKLDKSLIDFIGNYGGDRLLEHTIALAKELGMHVTAEGVESSEQVEFLQKLNCDSIQGFYYSRPLPAQEFEEKIR